jgi:N-acetylglucosamine malate deacetylase 1
MNKVLVIAPHPDDETLGCGGTLFRHKHNNDQLFWLIVTNISEDNGWRRDVVIKREKEINSVSKKYGFVKKYNLEFPTTSLNTNSTVKLIDKISDIYREIQPNIIYMPFINDVHTDHQIIAQSLQSTIKWFRYPFIKRVLMYETPSETEFNFVQGRIFKPNAFVDISKYLDIKVEIMKVYESEIGKHPFPRSEKNIRALATFRGSQSGFNAAEAFELVLDRK